MDSQEQQATAKTYLTSSDLLGGSSAKNTKITVDSLGNVELKYISFGDTDVFAGLLKEQSTDRGFVVKVLHHQIVEPPIDLETLEALSDSELQSLARAFVDNEEYVSDCFVDTGALYGDFRRALKDGLEKDTEQFRKLVEPIQRSIQQSSESLAQSFGPMLLAMGANQASLQNALQGLMDPFKQLGSIQSILYDSLRTSAESIESVTRSFNESLRPLVQSLQSWAAPSLRITDIYSSFWTEFEKRHKISAQTASRILRKYKWFIAPSMPTTFIYEVVKVGRSKGRQDKAVNSLFIQYFAADEWRNLEELVDSWKGNSLLKKRYKILRDCTHALKHVGGRSINVANLVLPTVIAQIDGAFSEYLTINNAPLRRYDEKVKKAKAIAPDIIGYDLDDLAKLVFLDILFQSAQTGTPLATPFNFNRHKILHGENVRYGRKDYVVRAFMVLDLLANW